MTLRHARHALLWWNQREPWNALQRFFEWRKGGSLDALAPIVSHYGYWLLVLVGFVEYLGLPIASVPVLVGAGALASMHALDVVPAALAVSAGGVAGDSVWYVLARSRGPRLVNRVCGLSTNPMACIHTVTERVTRIGPVYILPSKFLPGTGNLMAAASGFAGIRPQVFFPLDAAALAVWSAVYLTVGWVFADQVEAAIAWAIELGRYLVVTVVLVIGAAIMVRVLKGRLHRRAHLTASGELARVMAVEDASTPSP